MRISLALWAGQKGLPVMGEESRTWQKLEGGGQRLHSSGLPCQPGTWSKARPCQDFPEVANPACLLCKGQWRLGKHRSHHCLK